MKHLHAPARKLALAATLAAILSSASGLTAAATATQEVEDARQQARIETTYALNPYIRASEINVAVQGGKATLTGTVDEDVSKDLAGQIALGVSGIKEIDNQIKVQPDYVPKRSSDERTFGEVIDDASITTAVKSKLLWSKHASAMTTNVDTTRGRVTMTGTAESADARELATLLAINTHGVVSVDNQIKVEAPKATVADEAQQTASEAQADVADAWITAKVRSTLMYSSNVRSSAIEVNTKAGAVTLTGKAATGAERELAIELAKNVRGVVSVDASRLTH